MPASYQLPAALLLLVGGVVACFFGYRLFRIVLAIYGFIIGALVAGAFVGASTALSSLVTFVVGGLVGAIVLIAAYFVGVALAGAALGALVANVVWASFAGDPHPLVTVAFALFGAIGAMVFQRYVIVVSTAFGGAWTMIVGGLALVARTGGPLPAVRNPWRLNPIALEPGSAWVLMLWIVLSIAGMVVQLQHMKRKG